MVSVKRDFDFNFLLNIFSEIFPFTDNLFNILQTKSNDIGFCVKKIEEFKNLICNKRNEFEKFWEKTSNDNLEPQRKRIRTEFIVDRRTSYRRLFIEILDNITGQLNNRFKNFSGIQFLELCNFNEFKNKQFPQNALQSLSDNYGNFFDIVGLRSELSVIYATEDISQKHNVNELVIFIKENSLNQTYSEVLKLCELVLTIPATSASVERSFSALKRIKTFSRNSTSEERLSKLSLLAIERDFVKEMSENPNFYDEVISDFAKKERRIELHYK